MQRFRFYNFPRILGREAYQIAQEEFIATVSAHSAVRSIVRFGSVGYPGLSDLDLVVVFDKDATDVPVDINEISRFSSETQYILYHPQFVLREDLATKMAWLVPVFEREIVFGSSIEFDLPSENDQRTLNFSFVLQSVLTDLSWVFRGMAGGGEIDVRMAQAKLNLLARNLQLAASVDARFGEGSFPKSVSELRSQWFQYDLGELTMQLSSAIIGAKAELQRLSEWLGHFAQTELRLDGHLPGKFVNAGVTTEFRNANQFSSADYLSSHLLPLLSPALFGRGRIADWVKFHSILDDPTIEHAVLSPVRRRFQIAEEHVQYIEGLGLRSGIFNYMGYPVGYRAGLRSIVRRTFWLAQWRLTRQ
ncbi:MAG: nucleotidyltransferase domain-containing protein [Gemmatimonadaceae bacterium]|nr:nucleotidyltransferase domain-containing protein [Gemmatimonadaceae bacterium]